MRQVSVVLDNDLHEWLSRLAAKADTTRPRAVVMILREARRREVQLTPAGVTFQEAAE